MNENYSFAVIIPNYNNGQYLEKCIDSVLSQSAIPDEIIISDDASTDNSVDIIKLYESKFPNVIGLFNKVNKGVSYNRHVAILHSKSKYFSTLDSDDFYYSNTKLESEINLIKKFKEEFNEDVISYSNILIGDKHGKMLTHIYNKGNIKDGNVFFNTITRSFPIPLDYMVRRELYLNVGGFDKKIEMYEDWDLNIKLSKTNNFYFTGDFGTIYRKHGYGLSSANVDKHFKWLIFVFNKNLSNLEKKKRFFARLLFYKYLIIHITARYLKQHISWFHIILRFFGKY